MHSCHVPWFFTMGVSSFGNPRIEAYLQLPAAYRSLSRPSSAPDAKAFTLRSYSLELPSCIILIMLGSRSLNCLSFSPSFRSASEHFLFRVNIDSFRCEKAIRLLHFVLEFHLSVKLYFPYIWKDINNLLSLSSSVRFLLKSFFYSIVKDRTRPCRVQEFCHRRAVPNSALSYPDHNPDTWSVWMDSNHRPRAYQARALAT